VNRDKAAFPGKERGRRIEWTGACGDYFLAVVVEAENEVIAEHWGTRKEVLAWMETRWPQVPTRFVPMVYNRRREIAPSIAPVGADNGGVRSTFLMSGMAEP
jgi:hypothetical protein